MGYKSTFGTKTLFDTRQRKYDGGLSEGPLVTKVACQELAPGEKFLRVDTFSGGAHCCSVSYFLPPSATEEVFVVWFGHVDPDMIEDPFIDPNVNDKRAILKMVDFSLDSFSSGKLNLSFASSPTLPLYLCYRDRDFDICTLDFPDVPKRLSELEQQVKQSSNTLPRIDLSVEENRDQQEKFGRLVEYMALKILSGSQDTFDFLEPPTVRQKLVEAIKKRLENSNPSRKIPFADALGQITWED